MSLQEEADRYLQVTSRPGLEAIAFIAGEATIADWREVEVLLYRRLDEFFMLTVRNQGAFQGVLKTPIQNTLGTPPPLEKFPPLPPGQVPIMILAPPLDEEPIRVGHFLAVTLLTKGKILSFLKGE